MSKFIDAFARIRPRLLAMSPLVAAGAVASAVAAPDPATTGVIVAVVLQTLGNLAGNIAATDLHATLAERVLRDDVLKNQDLASAVRDAIGAIISRAAKDIPDADEKAALEKIARIDERLWAEAEASLWRSQTSERLSADEIFEMFSKSPEEFARFKALTLEEWRDLVGGLAAANSFAVEGDVFSAPGNLILSASAIDLAASHLHETFPRALYEILKEDFAQDGKAYGGLLIKLVGNISAMQVETRETAYEILSGTRKILETIERTQSIVERTEGKVDELHEKFDSFRANPSTSQPPARLAINLPSHNRIFTGREDVLSALKVELETTRRAALSGMPGVGKTQTATEYAHRQYAAQTYDYIIYARAATETELLTDFVSAAQLLHLPAKDAADFNLVAAAVKAWLEGADKWLLIFDNADDLAVVRLHLPANPKGHVILTRRPDNAGNVAHTIRINRMEADEGALLLLRRAELIEEAATTLDAVAPESAEGARAISREMYGLPLSLDIAGAYINETKKPLEGYLTLYRQQGRRLRQRLDKDDPYKKSVAQAFLLTIEQMAVPGDDEEASAVIARAAVDLLRLCAFLAPDAIPLDLIAAAATNWGDDLNRVRGDEIWWDETKAKATRFSLLSAASQTDAAPQAQTYDMHREVQAVVRDEMDDETQRLWAERNLQSLAAVFPDVREFANWEAGDLFLPHLQANLEHGDKLNIETETVALLKNQTGFHLNSRARYAEAEPLFKQALEVWQKLLGSEHPNVALSMNNLAELYRVQGRYAEAEPLYMQALELYKKLLGSEHPHVATNMNNLALLYDAQGRYAEAESLYVQALAMFEKTLGVNHPTTRIVRRNFEMFQKVKAAREAEQHNVGNDGEKDGD